MLKDIPQEDYLRFSLGYECAMFEVCLIIGYAFQNTWSVHNQDRLVERAKMYGRDVFTSPGYNETNVSIRVSGKDYPK